MVPLIPPSISNPITSQTSISRCPPARPTRGTNSQNPRVQPARCGRRDHFACQRPRARQCLLVAYVATHRFHRRELCSTTGPALLNQITSEFVPSSELSVEI